MATKASGSKRRGKRLLPAPIGFSRWQSLVVSIAVVSIGLIVIFIYASPPVYHDHWEYWGPRIKACESGNYDEHHRPSPGANGAWQFQDGTWAGYGGYARAYLAPPEVQDQAALALFQRRGTQPWDASYNCWRDSANILPFISQVPPPPPDNPKPVGAVDQLGCTITGWAYDRSDLSGASPVRFDIDGPTAGVVQADQPNDAVNAAYGVGSQHGFKWEVPAQWRGGQVHHIIVVAVDKSDPSVMVTIKDDKFSCINPFTGKGNGLAGNYYPNKMLANVPLVSRVDKTVSFFWDRSSPSLLLPDNGFSVSWTGRVLAQYTGRYTFYTDTDDGVRLWIGDKLIIDEWHDQKPTEHSAVMDLEAGKSYPVRMEYYENGGRSTARLLWSSFINNKEIIPQSQLFSN